MIGSHSMGLSSNCRCSLVPVPDIPQVFHPFPLGILFARPPHTPKFQLIVAFVPHNLGEIGGYALRLQPCRTWRRTHYHKEPPVYPTCSWDELAEFLCVYMSKIIGLKKLAEFHLVDTL
jgi:hypothetical protein